MRKFITKFRYYLALLIIVLTISNVTLMPKQSNSPDGVFTTQIWLISTD